MRSGSLICILVSFIFVTSILVSFIFVASPVEAKESDVTNPLYEVLEDDGAKLAKPYIIQRIQSYIDTMKPILNLTGIDERVNYLVNNGLDSMKLLINETKAVVIPDDQTQLYQVNKTLTHIIDEFVAVHETLTEAIAVIIAPSDALTRNDIKFLYLDLQQNSADVGKKRLRRALLQEINYLSSYIPKASGFEREFASNAEDRLVVLRNKLDDIQIPVLVQTAGKQVAQMTDIVGDFLGIYDVFLKNL